MGQLTILQLGVLKGVYDRQSIREIAAGQHRSVSVIQRVLASLEEAELVKNPASELGQVRARSRVVTEAGLNELRGARLVGQQHSL